MGRPPKSPVSLRRSTRGNDNGAGPSSPDTRITRSRGPVEDDLSPTSLISASSPRTKSRTSLRSPITATSPLTRRTSRSIPAPGLKLSPMAAQQGRRASLRTQGNDEGDDVAENGDEEGNGQAGPSTRRASLGSTSTLTAPTPSPVQSKRKYTRRDKPSTTKSRVSESDGYGNKRTGPSLKAMKALKRSGEGSGRGKVRRSVPMERRVSAPLSPKLGRRLSTKTSKGGQERLANGQASSSARLKDSNEAGPSSRSSRSDLSMQQSGLQNGDVSAAGIENQAGPSKTVEKRVLPARIRRAAGQGGEATRDLEDMIVDWLERWGLPILTPPDNLPIYITSLPLDMVNPPTSISRSSQPMAPPVTLTPSRNNIPPSPMATTRGKVPPSPVMSTRMVPPSPIIGMYPQPGPSGPSGSNWGSEQGKIETPSWMVVRKEQDDEMEALDEISGSRGPSSPLKRLRHAHGPQLSEDTSDEFYQNLHRKYEAFERRQKIREKEKLVFERYKMKSRLDTLRTLSTHSWTVIVNNVLSRSDGGMWNKGRAKLSDRGIDWLRSQLVKEGKEVLERYDQLLPHTNNHDNKKFKPEQTPAVTPQPSLSPPPPVLPERVTALRDLTTTKPGRGRKRKSFESPAATSHRSSRPRLSEMSNRSTKSAPRKHTDEKPKSEPLFNGRYKNPKTYGKRTLTVPKIPGLEEEIWVVRPHKRVPRVSKEEALEMKEVESEWL